MTSKPDPPCRVLYCCSEVECALAPIEMPRLGGAGNVDVDAVVAVVDAVVAVVDAVVDAVVIVLIVVVAVVLTVVAVAAVVPAAVVVPVFHYAHESFAFPLAIESRFPT